MSNHSNEKYLESLKETYEEIEDYLNCADDCIRDKGEHVITEFPDYDECEEMLGKLDEVLYPINKR